MRLSFFIFFSITILFSACSSDKGSGVTTNGFEYEFHTDKSGPIGNPGDYVFYHVMMKHLDKTLHDSRKSPNEPNMRLPEKSNQQSSKLNPIADGLSLMSEGDSLTIYRVYEEGSTPPPDVNFGEKVAITLVVTDIKTSHEYHSERQGLQSTEEKLKAVGGQVSTALKEYSSGKSDQIQTTESGLKYIIYEKGDGTQARPGDKVYVNYYGVLADGTEFENSYEKEEAFVFTLGLGEVIRGWDEGIALLKEGGRGIFIIPPSLGFGEEGTSSVPANSELIYYIALESVE